MHRFTLQAYSTMKYSEECCTQHNLRVGGHLVPAHIHSSDPSELPNGFATDDSTTTIVLVINIIITRYGALVVTLAMLLHLINCHFIIYYYLLLLLLSYNRLQRLSDLNASTV